LLERVGIGEPLRHYEQRQARHLAEAFEQQRERLLKLDCKALVAIRLDLVEHRLQRLAMSVACHPALDRSDAVDALDRAAVMKAEPIAQFEIVSELVGRHRVLPYHLRLRRELGVDCEQVVEYAI